MSAAVHITWHGAQINFGDLPPCLTYERERYTAVVDYCLIYIVPLKRRKVQHYTGLMMSEKFQKRAVSQYCNTVKLFPPLTSYFWLEMSRWGNEEITQALPFIIHTINNSLWGQIWISENIFILGKRVWKTLSITRVSHTFLEGWRLYTVKKVSGLPVPSRMIVW